MENNQTIEELRVRREQECFSIINRGEFGFEHLTYDQADQLREWYTAWLNVTETLVIPMKPTWLK